MFFRAVPAGAGEKGKIWFDNTRWGEIVILKHPLATKWVEVPCFWYSTGEEAIAAVSKSVWEGDYTYISPETGKRMSDEEILQRNGDPAPLECFVEDPEIVEFAFVDGRLWPKSEGETTFVVRYKGAECRVPITVRMIDPEDPSDAEAFREEVWKVELSGLEEGAIEDSLHHAGLHNEIYLSPAAFLRHSMVLCIDTTADPNFKCFVKDERIASLKPFGSYLLLETLEPGTTEIGFSWYGNEVSCPITVCRNTVEEFFCGGQGLGDDGTFQELPIYGDLHVVLPNADGQAESPLTLPLAVRMSDGSVHPLAMQYAMKWENSNPEVVDFAVNCELLAYAPGKSTVVCRVADKTLTIHVEVLESADGQPLVEPAG